MPTPTLRLITASFESEPAFDTAFSRALMQRVALGELPDTLRLTRPGAIVAFGKRDAVSRGYPAAVRAAREGGFEAVERLAGGRAAVFHEGTISFGHAVHDPDARSGIERRFQRTAEIVAAALRSLGVDARVGEVPGEYCPGPHSVNARGSRKLMGVGQRVIAGGAHVGGVVVVGGAERVSDILVPVYAALGLDWDPRTSGSVAEEAPGVTYEEVMAAIRAEYARRSDLIEAEPDPDTLALARALEPEHLSPDGSGPVHVQRL